MKRQNFFLIFCKFSIKYFTNDRIKYIMKAEIIYLHINIKLINFEYLVILINLIVI